MRIRLTTEWDTDTEPLYKDLSMEQLCKALAIKSKAMNVNIISVEQVDERVYVNLPLTSKEVCGHGDGRGTGMMLCGRAESQYNIERNGVIYRAVIEEGPCRKCNARERKRIEDEVDRREALRKGKV